MTVSALDEFFPFILEMMKNPPDPNAPIPLGNRHETVYGVTIPFHILSWIAVGCRLHTRFFVVHEPGVDDAFVFIAAIWNLIALIALIGGNFYVASAAYCTTTVCIKLSLLFQYLRIFCEGYWRTVTKALLVLIILWGSAFAFMSWVPCFPVSGFWNKHLVPSAKCYGFGYRTTKEAKNTLLAFSCSNMALDIAIFALPITQYFKPGLMRKQVLAMTGLLPWGCVVLMAFLRLWSGLKYNNTITMFDFTWWLPEVIIFSSLEVDFAIICASMPIFWPTVMAAWTEIFVTQEVTVIHDRRSLYIDSHSDELELDKTVSLKSHSSTDGLTISRSQETQPWFTKFDEESGIGSRSGITHTEIRPCVLLAKVA
ncbi:hypothetical protein GQ44DRAFT_747490 [Phaeosphaeriaceae sp. PMI808]|nr:hypothetical protein GQ44DRAFT_747490 [Phaeosphaeriaceae sp. PMI808]